MDLDGQSAVLGIDDIPSFSAEVSLGSRRQAGPCLSQALFCSLPQDFKLVQVKGWHILDRAMDIGRITFTGRYVVVPQVLYWGRIAWSP